MTRQRPICGQQSSSSATWHCLKYSISFRRVASSSPPLSLVILAGAYKFGWKTGLLAALLSPTVNHLITGMPAMEVLPVMTMKLAVLALVAGLAAQRFKTVNLPLLIGVVLVTKAIECVGELALTGGIAATIADFTIGWPGLLLQVLGTWLILKYIRK